MRSPGVAGISLPSSFASFTSASCNFIIASRCCRAFDRARFLHILLSAGRRRDRATRSFRTAFTRLIQAILGPGSSNVGLLFLGNRRLKPSRARRFPALLQGLDASAAAMLLA